MLARLFNAQVPPLIEKLAAIVFLTDDSICEAFDEPLVTSIYQLLSGLRALPPDMAGEICFEALQKCCEE